MAKILTFDGAMRRTKIALLFSGIKLEDVKFGTVVEAFFRRLYYFNVTWLMTDVIGEVFGFIEGVEIGLSFIELSLTAPCLGISLLGTARSIFLFANQSTIYIIIRKLKTIHPDDIITNFNNADEMKTVKNKANFVDAKIAEIENKENIEIIADATKSLNMANSLFAGLCLAVVVAFCSLPAAVMAFNYYRTGEIKFEYPYLTKYFFNHYTIERYPFVYFHQVYSTVVVATNLMATDSLFYALCLYLEMHFQLLCKRFENSVGGDQKTAKNTFKEFIRRHQELIEVVDNIEVLYSKSTLFNIIISSVLICLCGFILTMKSDITTIIMFMTFLCLNFSQIYLLCYFGDLLMKSSMAVSSALYNSQWYNSSSWIKKNVLFVIHRAQKPCKLTACNFADLNLNVFATILSRSWTYFALLRSMYD